MAVEGFRTFWKDRPSEHSTSMLQNRQREISTTKGRKIDRKKVNRNMSFTAFLSKPETDRIQSDLPNTGPAISDANDATPTERTIIACDELSIKHSMDMAKLYTEENINDISDDGSPKQYVTLDFMAPAEINYGPWADNQRFAFLANFLPYDYQHMQLHVPEVGQWRVFTHMIVSFNFHTTSIIRLPYRSLKLLEKQGIDVDAVGNKGANADVTLKFTSGSRLVYSQENWPRTREGTVSLVTGEFLNLKIIPSITEKPLIEAEVLQVCLVSYLSLIINLSPLLSLSLSVPRSSPSLFCLSVDLSLHLRSLFSLSLSFTLLIHFPLPPPPLYYIRFRSELSSLTRVSGMIRTNGILFSISDQLKCSGYKPMPQSLPNYLLTGSLSGIHGH